MVINAINAFDKTIEKLLRDSIDHLQENIGFFDGNDLFSEMCQRADSESMHLDCWMHGGILTVKKATIH